MATKFALTAAGSPGPPNNPLTSIAAVDARFRLRKSSSLDSPPGSPPAGALLKNKVELQLAQNLGLFRSSVSVFAARSKGSEIQEYILSRTGPGRRVEGSRIEGARALENNITTARFQSGRVAVPDHEPKAARRR